MNRLSLLIFIISLAWCCCNVKDSQQTGSTKDQQNDGLVTQRRGQAPTVFKQNISVIEGRIDSVITDDDRNFRVMVTINSSIPEEDIDSYADAGQQIICVPEYFIGDNGKIDEENNRNRKLMLLRGVKPGEHIKVKISLGRKGEWKIIEVVE
jgi:hypothetical protein